MLLGSDRGADSGGAARDEQDTRHSGNAGTEAPLPRCPTGWGSEVLTGSEALTRRGSEPALRPGHDHAESGYTPPVRVLQCLLLAFLKEFYPRSLEITVMKKTLSACSARWAYFFARRRFLRTVLGCATMAILATASVSACGGAPPTTPPNFTPGGPSPVTPTASGTPSATTPGSGPITSTPRPTSPGATTPGTATPNTRSPSTTAPSTAT